MTLQLLQKRCWVVLHCDAHCVQLQVLDLSANVIEDFDTQELPPALVILNLSSNPCCLDPDFRQRVISSLPDLMVSLKIPFVSVTWEYGST